MIVMKFGGSSLADSERIKNAAKIIKDKAAGQEVLVVLSAMKSVTNMLLEAADLAKQGDPSYKKILTALLEKKQNCAAGLFDAQKQESVMKHIHKQLDILGDILYGVELVRECSLKSRDMIVSFGECLSCYMMTEYLKEFSLPAWYLKASRVILTDSNFGSATVNLEESYLRIRQLVNKEGGLAVATGFIAADEKGNITTLGRNGSDYSASIFAAAFQGAELEIWTDVDGVLSVDPRIVKNAFVIPKLSVQEAMEMSYFGAEVIHPYTLIPAIDKNIRVWIKNTLNPETKGTVISTEESQSMGLITGIASINHTALINVEGSGMVGMKGVAGRIFSALAEADINIIMISQASSEHSICLVVRDGEAEKALDCLNTLFRRELENKQIRSFEYLNDLAVVAIVGDNMRGKPGISGKLFSTLGECKVNILAIAQGSSERNISFVIHKQDRDKALSCIHAAFLEEGGNE